MSVFLEDTDCTIWHGDALEVLRELPSESVHCTVTSPPFFGLRDYGVDGQIGLENSPEEWCTRLVDVFREVRRVLRKDGVCWIECGDSYTSNPAKGASGPGKESEYLGAEPFGTTRRSVPDGCKPKDLLGTPWLLAFALRADGWWLRSCVIWSKSNAMPESATDRPTTAHSYVFLLSKSARYWYDADAIREPAAWERWGDQTYSPEAEAMYGQRIKARTKNEIEAKYANPGNRSTNGQKPRTSERRGFDQRLERLDGKNARSVWTIPTEGYPDAHFATFPQELARRCILAGTSERGCCPECGAPWTRETEKHAEPHWKGGHKGRGVGDADGMTDMSHMGRFNWRVETLGWQPSCGHDLPPQPCTVLDPFGGSGTTGLVARKHGCRSILIELNEAYCRLAADRLAQQSLLAVP